jgi:hypothetical protein
MKLNESKLLSIFSFDSEMTGDNAGSGNGNGGMRTLSEIDLPVTGVGLKGERPGEEGPPIAEVAPIVEITHEALKSVSEPCFDISGVESMITDICL